MAEYFDVLTETGEKTGRIKERGQVHRDGDWHRAARVWLVRLSEKEGKICPQVLLQKRSRRKDSYPGLWDVSAAGHVSAGETVEEAALRETEEEIGVVLLPSELIPLFSMRSESRWESRGEWFLDREHHQVYMAVKDVEETALRLQEEETEAVRWIWAEELYGFLREGKLPSCIHWEEYERLYPLLAGLGG